MQRRRVRAVALPMVAGGEWVRTLGNSRFPSGMSIACSGGALRAVALPMVAGWEWVRTLGKSNSRFPSGMTTRKARATTVARAMAVVWLTADP